MTDNYKIKEINKDQNAMKNIRVLRNILIKAGFDVNNIKAHKNEWREWVFEIKAH